MWSPPRWGSPACLATSRGARAAWPARQGWALQTHRRAPQPGWTQRAPLSIQLLILNPPPPLLLLSSLPRTLLLSHSAFSNWKVVDEVFDSLCLLSAVQRNRDEPDSTPDCSEQGGTKITLFILSNCNMVVTILSFIKYVIFQSIFSSPQ